MASTVNRLSIFWFKFCNIYVKKFREIPLYMRLVLIQIAIVGITGGIASTYSSIDAFLDPTSQLDPPCYVGRTNKTYFIQ